MLKLKKKIKDLFAVSLILNVFMMYNIPSDAFAEDSSNYLNDELNDNVNVFTEEKQEYENIEKKVNDEIETHTEMLNYDVEDYLNEQGVYDDELSEINSIDELNTINIDNLRVYTGYYAISDEPSKKNVPITDEEMRQLSSQEVDSLIENVYYDGHNEIVNNKHNNSKDGMKNKILTKMGIRPINAYAAVKTVGGGNESYLKKTIIALNCKLDGKQYLKLHYITTWTTMPKYRNVDVVSLTWTNATYEYGLQDHISVVQSWKTQSGWYDADSKHIFNEKNNSYRKVFNYYSNPRALKASQYCVESNQFVAAVKLHEDFKNKYYTEQRQYDIINYYDESMHIELLLEIDTRKRNTVIKPYYQHLKENIDVGSLIIDMTSGYVTAVYSLLSGRYIQPKYSFSGVTFEMPYEFSFK